MYLQPRSFFEKKLKDASIEVLYEILEPGGAMNDKTRSILLTLLKENEIGLVKERLAGWLFSHQSY